MANLPALTEEQRQELTDPRSDFSAEDRVAIAMTHILAGGNAGLAAARASRMLSKEIPAATIRQWKRRPWWLQASDIAKQMLQKELEDKYTRFLHKTEEEMLDRVENGDYRLTKDGQVIRVKVTLRDLVGGHAIVSDKRAMLRGEPTSRTEDVGLALAKKLADVLHRTGEKQLHATVLEGDFEVVEEPSDEE